MNVFMDDIRNPEYYHHGYTEWVVVRTVEQTWNLLKTGRVEQLSLDHDMGNSQLTGYDLLCIMEEHNVWSKHIPFVHSMNPVGRQRMQQVIDRKYRK